MHLRFYIPCVLERDLKKYVLQLYGIIKMMTPGAGKLLYRDEIPRHVVGYKISNYSGVTVNGKSPKVYVEF